MIEKIEKDNIITFIELDDKNYIAYTKSKEPSDGDDIYFAECSNIDGKDVLLPIVSEDILKKVNEKYDEYENLMLNEDELEDISEEDE